MKAAPTPFHPGKFLAWVATILVPVALVLTSVRLLITHPFLSIEYNLPGFPEDSFGFNTADRLYWSRIAVDYLVNSADISFLGNLRFTDGSPVYNERELSHMVDVKNVVQGALRVWYGSLVGLIGLGAWTWKGKWWPEYRKGLMRGGWLTVILLGSVSLFVLLSFGVIFVAFHNVFFTEGTWIFLYSDTLIRLFPERFWRDTFIFVGGLSLAGGFIVALFSHRK